MLHETYQKGEIAFLRCALRAVEKGMVVSRPTVDTRYDAILDTGKKLLRVQVKYADGKSTHAAGSVVVGLKKTNRRGETKSYTKDEIDALLVFVPKIDAVLMFAPKDFHGKNEITVRLEPPKNNQKKSVKLAETFRW